MNKRAIRIIVSQEILGQLLDLPEGAKVVNLRPTGNRPDFEIVIEGVGPVLKENVEIPVGDIVVSAESGISKWIQAKPATIDWLDPNNQWISTQFWFRKKEGAQEVDPIGSQGGYEVPYGSGSIGQMPPE